MNTSKSIGYSCQNSHKSKNRGGENDDMEQKKNSLKSVGFSLRNWQVMKFMEIQSLPGRRYLEEFLRRSDIIYY